MYIPLYVKSNYSLLSSMLKIDDIISYSVTKKIPYAVISDINMYGVMEFITKCNKNNITPIISLSIKYNNFEIVLFVKNYNGYKSLIKLSTIFNEREILKNDLIKFNDGLLVVIPYSSLDIYDELNTIYDEVYLGYQNKKEELEVSKITDKYVFFRECLYLYKNDSELLKYLYLIRDGKTILVIISLIMNLI